jgi:NitT/TauT family transport system ATP-binding protein
LPTLTFKSVSLCYNSEKGETGALQGVDFEVESGAFVAIVGPSGCGKSTLLSLAAGLLHPDEGSVLLDGTPVTRPTSRIGYMLQRDHLFDWLTIEQNAMLGLRVRAMQSAHTAQRVRALLDQCGLSDFMHAYPRQLSGGMRQRAALVRTLAPDPAVLLLDEPFSALDYQTRLSVAGDVYRIIKRHHKTALLVTHDISEAVSMADQVVVLSKRPGHVQRIVPIKLTGEPLTRRMQPGFGDYFNLLWKELEHDVV